ncbi:MAG: FKBP-type peptidyl-prolyl cis-trans isomerase [Candidatus Binatia bacterium]
MRKTSYQWIFILLSVFGLGYDGLAQTEKAETLIKDGSRVSLEYTLSDSNGTVIESNNGKQPLTYTHGQAQLLPALEKELAGLKPGDHRNVVLKPEDAYGQVDPNAFREVPKGNIPPESLKVGAQLAATSPQGQTYPVRIHEVKDDTVVLDFNHPLAGKTLSFNVTIVNVASEGQ